MNDKDTKRKLQFAEFFLKYGKIFVVALIVLAFWLGRGQFSEMVYKLTHWNEYVENRGDRLLTQHLFVADRMYVEDPPSWEITEDLAHGTYYYNVREGSDLTIIQQKIELENGDIFRHETVPYAEFMKMSSVDTLKFIKRYRYDSLTIHYYDWAADEWVEMDRVKGGATIPSDTVVYMNFDDEYYVLMDHLYAYNSVEDGVMEKNESLEKTTYLNTAAGGGWETLTSFYPREGTEYQFWSLESRNPLIDVDSEESKALLLKELGLGQKCRWLEDGYYVPMEEGQSPYAAGRYYRAPAQLGLLNLRAAGALSDDPSTRGAADLFYVQSFLASQAMSDSGYYPTQVQDDRLYAEYGIKYGYMDLEENAWFGIFLANAWDAAEEPVIKEKIERLSAFFVDYIEAHGKTVSAGGKEGIVVPAYWLEKGDIVSGEASDAANSLLATFLKEAGRILENDSYADLAGSLEAGSLALMMGGKVTF